jgi:hypothetical protein
MPVPPSRVLLLHDQLMDARIWGGFVDLVAAHARPVPVLAPGPTTLLSVPSQWARHIGDQARGLLDWESPVALAVATGWSAGAAVSLVDDGLAGRALLLNPGPDPALFEEGREGSPAGVDPETLERIRSQASPLPEPTGAWADELRAGYVGDSAAAHFLELAVEPPGTLDDEQVRLVRSIQTENFGRLLPLSFEDIQPAGERDPGWVPVLARHPESCGVAFSGPPGTYREMLALLRRRVPEVRIIETGLRGSVPWLEDPGLLDRLVRDLLTRER